MDIGCLVAARAALSRLRARVIVRVQPTREDRMAKTVHMPEPSIPEGPSPRWIERWLDARALLGAFVKAARKDPLRDAAEALERDGAVVFAAAPGWPRPPVINGFIPDVYAVYEDHEILLELDDEAPASEGSEPPALRRGDAFAAWAVEAEGREYQQIAAPGARGKA
jgi:hypothetical protein